MDSATIRSIIDRREKTNIEWSDGIERCWKDLTDALTQDFETTKKFLLEECDEDEYLLVSEVYDDVVSKTQSQDYVDLLRKSMKRFPNLAKEYHLEEDLDLAAKTMLLD